MERLPLFRKPHGCLPFCGTNPESMTGLAMLQANEACLSLVYHSFSVPCRPARALNMEGEFQVNGHS